MGFFYLLGSDVIVMSYVAILVSETHPVTIVVCLCKEEQE